MSSILIKNGQIITETFHFSADILVIDNKIKSIAGDLEKPDADTTVLDAAEFYVFPGAIDAHVHFDLAIGNNQFSADNFLSGTKAALAGGTTSIIDFVTPEKDQSLVDAFHERKKQAEKSVCDYGFHMSIVTWRPELDDEIKQCITNYGMTSFKTYMAYKETIGLDDEQLIAAMDSVGKHQGLITAHCEHGDLLNYLRDKLVVSGKCAPKYHAQSRPNETEREAVSRAVLFAEMTNCPLYIVHVSTSEAVSEIAKARLKGHRVFAETCPHYLLLDDREYERDGFQGAAYVMSPPLRKSKDNDGLWKALSNGNIQTLATDHCPFQFKGQKELGMKDFRKIPNGVAGVEDRLKLAYSYGVLNNKLTLNQFVAVNSLNPAKIFGLYPRKGSISVNADADIVIWNPETENVISAKTHLQNCDSNIYEGFKIKGQAQIVISNGKIVYDAGKITCEHGCGNYLYRNKTIF